jgi:hypothetical protein
MTHLLYLGLVYIGKICTQKCPQNRIMILPSLLALGTLGGMTEIETILSVSCRPRWPMQVLFHVAVAVTVATIIT